LKRHRDELDGIWYLFDVKGGDEKKRLVLEFVGSESQTNI